MPEPPWPVADSVDCARAVLLRDGAVTDGFRGLDVQTTGSELVVVFRWRLDPSTYAVRFGLPWHPPCSPWTAMPVDSTEQWADDLSGLLAEELNTGAARRARRTRHGEIVELDLADAPDRFGDEYYVSRVPTDGDPGRGLQDAGADLSWPRRELAAGRLLSWLQVHVNNERAEPVVGHAASAWAPGAETARLGALHVESGTPDRVAHALVHHAVHDAAEAGASRVITELTGAGPAAAGFEPVAPGLWGLATADAGWYS